MVARHPRCGACRVTAEERASHARREVSARVLIATTGPHSGLVIAVMPPESLYVNSARLAVGDIHRISPDGEPEKWRAWLWPEAGGALHVTRSCEAVDAGDLKRLGERLQKRA